MMSDTLTKHFSRISEAPDAVARMRRFILNLAVRGKLVEQDPNDESAAKLLKRIQAEKVRLVNEGILRRTKELEPVGEGEIPFQIPALWVVTRLGEVYDVRDGTHDTPKYVDAGYPLITSKNLSTGRLSFEDVKFISEKDHQQISNRSFVEQCDVLLAMIGSIGNPVIVDTDRLFSIKNVALFKRYDRSASDPYFLCLFLKSAAGDMQNLAKGGLQPFVSLGFLRDYPIPLPPLAEQRRIVAKVDELMTLCDHLETGRSEREALRDRMVAASLHRIGSTDAMPADVRFHLDHLSQLTIRKEHIKQLRQTILNLAVRGRLVPQDPKDETISAIFKRMQLAFSLGSPFPLPASWVWVSVCHVSKSRLGKMLDKAKNKGTPHRYLRNINVRWFDIDLSDLHEMPFEERELDEYSLCCGDVLICEGGEPGRAAVWDNREDGMLFQKAIHRVRFANGVNPYYFVNVLRESADSGRLASYFTGVGIKHFTGKGLASFVIPLPPLAEQNRIVTKVNELMALCDQLDTQLITIENDSSRLLEAVLRDALAGAP
jgi:type I restriction enzyme, S subunit